VLLKQIAEALVALDTGLRRMPKRPQVRLITVSEFGRRLQENSTRGTDHGNASVAFVFGELGQLALTGFYPRLDRLDRIRGQDSEGADEEAPHPTQRSSWPDLLKSI
jgi:uncharacterized protein (DUF1501 family)